MIYYRYNSLKLWNCYMCSRLGTYIGVVIAIVLVISIQVLLYNLLTSQNIDCKLHNLRSRRLGRDTELMPIPKIYVITPTYFRHVQKAELTRLSHTFMLVPNLHWIIIEDSDTKTDLVEKFIQRLKNEFEFYDITHLNERTPREFKLVPGEASWKKPRGVWQRNKAIEWLKANQKSLDNNGIVYFADDDNTYDLNIFSEMRTTERISVWPVAFVGGLLVERPLVNSDGRIYSFNSRWKSGRPFPFDMAGFAVKLRLILKSSNAKFSSSEEIGLVESHFIRNFIVNWTELEPKADLCTKVLVWHTKTQKPDLHLEKHLSVPSNYEMT